MSPIRARRPPDAPREPRAEAPDAAESDVHADLGHGSLAPRQQPLRAIEPLARSILMRRLAEHRRETPDQLAGRKARLASDARERHTLLVLAQALTRATEPRE